jgi:hypothetical protein
MLSRKAIVIASLSTIVCSAAFADDGFKSSKFLTYPADSQKSYIGTSVMMAGTVASLNNPAQAKCVDDWAAEHQGSGYDPVISAMRKFPDDHPSGLILAVLVKACGPFKYR